MTGNERMVLSGGQTNPLVVEQVLRLTDKTAPNIVVDLSAAVSQEYFNGARTYLSKLFIPRRVKLAWLQDDWEKPVDSAEQQRLVKNADAIYVTNGSMKRITDSWGKDLRWNVWSRVVAGNLVGSGAGTGALWWFDQAHYDSEAENSIYKFRLWESLGVLPGIASAGYNQINDQSGDDAQRKADFESLLKGKRYKGLALGLGRYAGVVVSHGSMSTRCFTDDETIRHRPVSRVHRHINGDETFKLPQNKPFVTGL